MSQSIQEIQKLRDEYRKFQNQGNNSMNSIEDIDNDISNAEMIEINNNEIVDLSKQNVDKSEKNYFGFDFFSNRETVSFWENIPVSENYLLGPGDELIISIWGETQLRKNTLFPEMVKYMTTELDYCQLRINLYLMHNFT